MGDADSHAQGRDYSASVATMPLSAREVRWLRRSVVVRRWWWSRCKAWLVVRVAWPSRAVISLAVAVVGEASRVRARAIRVAAGEGGRAEQGFAVSSYCSGMGLLVTHRGRETAAIGEGEELHAGDQFAGHSDTTTSAAT